MHRTQEAVTDVATLAEIKDLGLADRGRQRIEWADAQMPVLKDIRERFAKETPLQGQRIGVCLHVTAETANLVRTLKAGGAQVTLCASNPLSTQDDVAASLVRDDGVPTLAMAGESTETLYRHLKTVIETRPTLTLDDGCDMVSLIHKEYRDLISNIIGGTEETTTGVVRLRAMATAGVLEYPVIAVNEAQTKHLFDNRYGTGQSTLDAIMRATNFLFSGRTIVVAGYGWCGRGVAARAKGLGAHVIVTEVDPIKALEACCDGFVVLPMAQAAPVGDVFITVTGNLSVIREEHFKSMKDGAFLCNAGHFDVEIDVAALARIAVSRRSVRPHVEAFTLHDGRRLHLLCAGRLVNLIAGEGHPSLVMDMSFSNQALSVEYLVRHHGNLPRTVMGVPTAIDHEVARLKLKSIGIPIDVLSPEQVRYLAAWQQGT